MGLQGINVNGTLYRYDYEALENKPTIPEAGDGLPTVTASDAGKVLMVDNNGNWTLGQN